MAWYECSGKADCHVADRVRRMDIASQQLLLREGVHTVFLYWSGERKRKKIERDQGKIYGHC